MEPNWVALGTVSGNDLVKRTVNFSPSTTDPRCAATHSTDDSTHI
jgi:hypothetical protein